MSASVQSKATQANEGDRWSLNMAEEKEANVGGLDRAESRGDSRGDVIVEPGRLWAEASRRSSIPDMVNAVIYI